MSINYTNTTPFSRTEEVRSFEVNPEKRLNIAGIARKFQEIAWEHASKLNYGFYDLEKRDLHWVLSRTEIIIHRAPEWNEYIDVATWPSGLDSLFFTRDFEYSDKNNDVCVAGSSSWMIINKNLRPQIPNHAISEIPVYNKKAIHKTAEKLKCHDDMENIFAVKIRLSDLDPNYHTNNVRYYQWVCDCLKEKGISDNLIKHVEMNFLHECKLNDILYIQHLNMNNTHWIKGIRNNIQDVFLCKVELT